MVGDLVYTDATGAEQGVITAYELDMAWGKDENDFELRLGASPKLVCGSRVYIDGTELGGIVDSMSADETSGSVEVTYSGRTWHGILADRVIEPPTGSAYYTFSGDANAVVSGVVASVGLSSVFSVATSTVKTISGKFDRYCTAWAGLVKVLNANGLRLDVFKEAGGSVKLAAVAQGDYSGEYYSDQFDFKVEDDMRPINHLVCLGKGQLEAREVVHLYADASGNVSTTKTLTGLAERVEVYSNANATDSPEGDEETLTESGTKKLKEYQNKSTIELSVHDDLGCHIGDKIGAQSVTTGVAVTSVVNKIILKIGSDGVPVMSYEVGNLTEESEEEL